MPVFKTNNNVFKIFKGTTEIKQVFRETTEIFDAATKAPTLSFVSRSQTRITLRVLNNDTQTVTFTQISYGSTNFTSTLTIAPNATRDFNITGLAINTNYNFTATVTAAPKNASPNSNTVNQSTLAQVAPTFSNVSSNSNSITFRVRNRNSESSVVRARLNANPTSSSTPAVTLNASATSGNLQFTGLSASTTYSLRAASFINNIRGPVRSQNVTTQAPSIVTNGLILHLDAGDPNSYPGSGTRWFDISPNTSHGTLFNSTFSSTNGGILNFNGNTAYALIDGNPPVDDNLPQFSATAFIRRNTNSGGAVFSKRAGCPDSFRSPGNNRSIEMTVNEFGDLAFVYPNGSGGGTGPSRRGADNIIAEGVIPANQWVLVAITFTSSKLALYVNGIEVANVTPTVSTILRSAQQLRIGSAWSFCGNVSQISNAFSGSISNVLFYNSALSASEVQQNFNATRGRFGI